MPEKKIMYRSKPGFHGADGVTYETTYRSGKWSTTATI
jgi:hypothetical protein